MSLESLSRKIDDFTTEQLAKERQRRADCEELFHRISHEAEVNSCTFAQGAKRLGLPHEIVDHFQADRENAAATRKKMHDFPGDEKTTAHPWVRSFKSPLKNNFPVGVFRIVAVLGPIVLLALAAMFFRYDVRTADDKGYVVLRVDRWTGNFERCIIRRQGCSSY